MFARVAEYKQTKWVPLLIFFFVLITHVLVSWQTVTKSLSELVEESPRPLKIKIKSVKKKKQIVNTEKVKYELEPKETRFLSEQDQTVAREVIAKTIASHKTAGKGVKNGAKEASQDSSPVKMKKKKKKKLTSLKDLAMTPQPTPVPAKKQSKAMPKKGERNGDPSKGGLSSNNDFIEEVELGDMTQLNTVRFKYFGFYQRIRKKLEQYWGQSIQEKARKLFASGRRLPAQRNYITSVKITMDDRGNIIGILINGSSGIRDLDDAAVESFNKAGPFPNPPKGLIKNGRATIEWGFVVKG